MKTDGCPTVKPGGSQVSFSIIVANETKQWEGAEWEFICTVQMSVAGGTS